MPDCKEFQPINSFQWFLNWCKLNVVIWFKFKFANVICDFRCFVEKVFKWMRGRRVVIKDDASKDMFPAYRNKFMADKWTSSQCWMGIIVFCEKIKDRFFNFEGEVKRAWELLYLSQNLNFQELETLILSHWQLHLPLLPVGHQTLIRSHSWIRSIKETLFKSTGVTYVGLTKITLAIVNLIYKLYSWTCHNPYLQNNL